MAFGRVIPVVFALFYANFAMAGDAGNRPSDSEVLASFETAVFGPAPETAESRLFKWDRPIRVRLVGRAPKRYRTWAIDHVDRLSELTGLELQVAEDIAADLVIYFVPRFSDVADGEYNSILKRYLPDPAQMQAVLKGYRASKAACGGQVNARGQALNEAIVFVPVDRLPQVVHGCLGAELLRMFGLLFPLPEEAGSVLATDSPHSHLTALDEALIALLYDARLKAGMTRKAAREVAAEALSARP